MQSDPPDVVSQPTPHIDITPAGDSGAVVTAVYVKRKMLVYAVSEGDLETLAIMNTQATVFFSIFSALLALSAGIWTNAAFAAPDTMPAAGKILAWFGAPVIVVLALVFLGLGVWATVKKRSTWNRIKNESDAG